MGVVQRIPLSWLVTAVIVVTVVVVAGTGLAVVAASQADAIRNRQLGEAIRAAQLMAAFAAVDLVFDARDQAAKDLAMLRSHPDMESAVLYDSTGQRFAAWHRETATAVPQLRPRALPHATPSSRRISSEFIEVQVPVHDRDRMLGTLHVLLSTREVQAQLQRLMGQLVTLGVGVLVTSVLIAVLLQRLVSQPILAIANVAARISATGDYSLRVTTAGSRELVALGHSFNDALVAIEQREQQRDQAEAALRVSESQLQQSQKMEAMGRLAGGVAHDFNNMLTAILSYARMLSDGLPEGDPMRLDLEQIITAAERSAGLTRQLLAFSRRQLIQPQLLDLGHVVHGVEGMLRRVIGEDVVLRVDVAPSLPPVIGDVGQIEQVLVNLVVNARDAMPQGGLLTVELREIKLEQPRIARMSTIPPARYVQLAVTDTGVGMSEDTLGHIFEPFFTTKPTGQGTGLGLATVFGIVKQTGGDIVVHSQLGEGTRFEIYLPRATASPMVGPPPAPGALDGQGHGETVLLVEDEALVRESVHRILTAGGYTVLQARSGREALRVAAEHHKNIDILLTDVVMPGMTGRDLADELARVQPGLRVLYMSGYTADVMGRHGVLEAGIDLIIKPFTPKALRHKVREVLDRPVRRLHAP